MEEDKKKDDEEYHLMKFKFLMFRFKPRHYTMIDGHMVLDNDPVEFRRIGERTEENQEKSRKIP